MKSKRRVLKMPASAGFGSDMDLLHLDRDFQVGGISDEPFLDVKAADDGGFALGLNLGELHGVLGVFLFLELNDLGLLFHNAAFRCWVDC
jgi:hypothetical protein